jgi:hypothetical protein
MSADTLTVTSRAFYERSKFKIAVSIVAGGAALFFLGFCSAAGGESQASQDLSKGLSTGSNAYKSYQSLAGGYGKKFLSSKEN